MKKMLFLLLAVVLASCEKPFLDSEENGNTKEGNVILKFTPYVTTAMTRSGRPITELCSRLNVALFNESGSKVASDAQKESDDDFGTAAFDLTEGTYTVVAIAHSCNGSATISSPQKVTFPSNKVTDTFYYYGTITVGENPETYSFIMTRAVAMFRLTLTDETIPESLAQMKFYYTGGSSTFDPSSGYGCVNSKQTEYRSASSEIRTYEVYTFPKAAAGKLKMTVTALNATDVSIMERLFEDVPVKTNTVTAYDGCFFDGSSGVITQSGFDFTGNPDWESVNTYNF